MKTHKSLPKFQVEEKTRASGHMVLASAIPLQLQTHRTHMDRTQNTIRSDNNTFKLDQVKIAYQGFARITREQWSECVRRYRRRRTEILDI